MNLVWLRNDLRLDDNPALYHACQQDSPAIAIFIATPGQWMIHNDSPAKLALKNASLDVLSISLAKLGIQLEVVSTEYFDGCAQLLTDYCLNNDITSVWFNREFPVDEYERDQKVFAALQQIDVKVHAHTADLIVPEPIQNLQGEYYKVFTPWYKAWTRTISSTSFNILPAPAKKREALTPSVNATSFLISETYRQDLWPADETSALNKLTDFIESRSADYQLHRDYPALNGTSTISPYLATGILSIRRCLHEILQHCEYQGTDWREDTWARELGWREFYRNLMIGFPKLSKGEPFKEETKRIRWENHPIQLQAWKEGQTGFPIIDAAMRQLQRTGWMHNRLRMLTASFFSKLMLHDWHTGEAYFMQHLIDGDFASNNGGWQWSASTGCDASPWFRIFSPERQSEKFDPEGKFIKKMIPELGSVDIKHLHNPAPEIREAVHYPQPILDYKTARIRALDRFKNS